MPRKHSKKRHGMTKKGKVCNNDLGDFRKVISTFGDALRRESTIEFRFTKDQQTVINEITDSISALFNKEKVSFDKTVFKDLVKKIYSGMARGKSGGMFRRLVGSRSVRSSRSSYAMARLEDDQAVVPRQTQSRRGQGFFGRVMAMLPDLLAILYFLVSIYLVYLAYCKMDNLVKSIQVGNQVGMAEMSSEMIQEIKRVFADLKVQELGFLKFMYTGITTFSCNIYSNLQSSLNESLILLLKASSKDIAEGARTYCIGSDGSWTEWISSISDVGATAQCIAMVSSNEAVGIMQNGLRHLNNLLAKTNMTTSQVRSLLGYGCNGLIASGGYFLARVGYITVVRPGRALGNGSEYMEIGNGDEEEEVPRMSTRSSSLLRIGNGDESPRPLGRSSAGFDGGERFSMRSTQKRRM
jgi:hypothetical protein